MILRLLFSAAFLSTFLASASQAEPTTNSFTFHREHVLGTSLEVQVDAPTEEAARAAEQAAFDEIGRLARIFSSYDPHSELRRWQARPGEPTRLSPELAEVLRASQQWTTLSRGAFQPGVEGLSKLWREAVSTGVAPSQKQIDDQLDLLRQPLWRLEGSTASPIGTWRGQGEMTLNAIAKGAIVDRACTVAATRPDVAGALVSIGGDMRACGSLTRNVGIVDPAHDAENAPPLRAVRLTAGGLATSGRFRRGFLVGGTWHSHILDPRTGQPARGIASATVVARTAADADALATICCVLSPAESLALIDSIDGARCLLIDDENRVIESSRWGDVDAAGQSLLAAADQASEAGAGSKTEADGRQKDEKPAEPAKGKKEPKLLELVVQFELTKAERYDYNRPYVAVWLEDEGGKPVRTGLLWIETKQPGPQWHRELLRWYRNDQARLKTDETVLIGAISGPTRGPGEYKVVFDGLDDRGNVLEPGKYTLFLEASREHGTYQLIRKPLTLGAEPIPLTKLKGDVEIPAASIEYQARLKE